MIQWWEASETFIEGKQLYNEKNLEQKMAA